MKIGSMKCKLFLFSFFSLFMELSGFTQAEQDSIILLNGKVYRGVITSAENGELSFEERNKKGELNVSQLPYYRIFSYTQAGVETIVYEENEFGGDYLTVEEAKNATLGSYDARQTFKPRMVFWSSLVMGYGASLYDTYLNQKSIDHPDYVGSETSPGFFKSRPSVFPFFIPAVLTVSWALPSFKIKYKNILQKQLINDVSYYRGFHRIAKQKRVLSALKGSLIGIGLGFVSYAAFN